MQSPDTATKLSSLKDIEWILKDVSFTVEPGQTVAIVGHTGAGKTTLTSLMMRFYDVTAGQILVDGVDLREQDLTALRQHFAVVSAGPISSLPALWPKTFAWGTTRLWMPNCGKLRWT